MVERITKKNLQEKFNQFKAQAENDGFNVYEWGLRLGSGTQGVKYGFSYKTGIYMTLGKTAKEAFAALSFMLDGWVLRNSSPKLELAQWEKDLLAGEKKN